MISAFATVNICGNGLVVRLTKSQAKVAGVVKGTKLRLLVEPGRITLEAEARPSLTQMVAAFDPVKHGGEAMADSPVGVEAFASR